MESESKARGDSAGKWGRALRVLLKVFLFPFGILVLTQMYMAAFEYGNTEVVGAEIPSSFPIVVVREKNGEPSACMINYGLLETFKEKYPDTVFRVPPERLHELQHSVSQNTRECYRANDWYPVPFYAGFSMKEARDGSQEFRTSMPPDDDFEMKGWYRVSEAKIEARYFLYYRGIGPALSATTTSFMTMVAIYVALPVWRLLVRIVGRRRSARNALEKHGATSEM